MSGVDNFKDNQKACWSEVLTRKGDRIFISIAGTDVIIKKKGVVFSGKTIFKSNVSTTSKTIIQLNQMFGDISGIIPEGMTNPALKAFSHAAMTADNADDLKELLNGIQSELR